MEDSLEGEGLLAGSLVEASLWKEVWVRLEVAWGLVLQSAR